MTFLEHVGAWFAALLDILAGAEVTILPGSPSLLEFGIFIWLAGMAAVFIGRIVRGARSD